MKENYNIKYCIRLRKLLCTAVLMLVTVLVNGCGSSSETTLEELLAEETGRSQSSEASETANQTESANGQTVWVHMCGEVAVPGIYELPVGSRIYDGLVAAGGFTKDADTTFYNLAETVSDGMQVVIPGKNAQASGDEATLQKTKEDGLININTATSQELQTLPGIGASRAADIIAYREKCGGFTKIEQIMEVSGIKSAVFEKIKDCITIK